MKERGFTILELVLVITLMVLIAAASGMYMGTYREMLVKRAARDVVLAARYAKVLAVEQQHKCTVVFEGEGNQIALWADKVNEETSNIEKIRVNDIYFKPIKFSGEVKVEKVEIMPDEQEGSLEAEEQKQIVFRPDGTATGTVIQIGDGKSHYTVSISAATGKAEVYAGGTEAVKVGTIDLDEQS